MTNNGGGGEAPGPGRRQPAGHHHTITHGRALLPSSAVGRYGRALLPSVRLLRWVAAHGHHHGHRWRSILTGHLDGALRRGT